MRSRFLKILSSIRASYWFIPTVLSVFAAVMATVLLRVDERVGADFLDFAPWVYETGASGARELLSMIAQSMITVAGVVFSITIAAVAHASAQFGPRLLHNFMRDRGNQFTLGIFVATFLYCLLVLRTIKDLGDDGTFVPHLSVLGAIVLALGSVSVLIYFIHHIPESIHVSQVVARVGRSLHHKIAEVFPADLGRDSGDATSTGDRVGLPDGFFTESTEVNSRWTGYIQRIDSGTLMELAREHDLIVLLLYRPGDFVTEGRPVFRVWPGFRVKDSVRRDIEVAFATGHHRTYDQDALFLVDELVETATRALSTGINDPFTAAQCMDWLGSALTCMVGKELPDDCRYDADSNLRMVVQPLTFEVFAGAVFDQLRPYVSADLNAGLHMFKVLTEVGLAARTDEERRILATHTDALLASAQRHAKLPRDEEALIKAHRAALQAIRAGHSGSLPPRREDWF
jgi:uncharacterized membrane protein